ncbi:TauD/TfdA family dioxygenase [Luteibacter sp. ME-Dv--P-043b]|uniref:TauD/TfdA family dioxygenase n=1 Tax=Luteibacter sp. ME-Dv--P-043b TaxID=3040291 RepID=UPI00255382A2|nr:TauD/TfdA family dioxygenase [Luteibacter sp. ME-Dv--P-043b]
MSDVDSRNGVAENHRHAVLHPVDRMPPSVRTLLFENCRLPLIVEPVADREVLSEWVCEHREFLDAQLNIFGALLFRGFEADENSFETIISGTSSGALPYTERSSPRSRVTGNVYTSTDYPPDYPIFLHNEQSYNLSFPRKIYFMCIDAAARNGATPIADVRRVYARLRSEVVAEFAKRKYLYQRLLGGDIGLHWHDVFQTSDRTQVEAYCRENDIAVEWLEGGRLRTRQVRETAARHPATGELCWFNHLTFFHVTTLPEDIRNIFTELMPDDELPNNTYYGDGGIIEADVLAALREAYEIESVAFPWQRSDVLMLDNMTVAHGRESYEGYRRILTGFADLCDWKNVATGD